MEKEKKIAVNPSSGVEKVENVQKELAEQQKKENAQVAVQKKITKKAVKKTKYEEKANIQQKTEHLQ